jgi:hypothetical protein
MGQRKYIIFVLLILFPFKAFCSTAWLPDESKYKYSISSSITDKESKDVKLLRIQAFNIGEQILDKLISRIMYLNQDDTVIQLAKINNIKLDKNGNVPQYFKNIIKNEINKIQLSVDKLKEELCLLSPYQQQQITSTYIEYAPIHNMSFGINGYYKEDVFTNSKYTSSKRKSDTKSMSFFYKYKIFQNNNFILSIQPQLTVNRHSTLSCETLQELIFLAGVTKSKGEYEFFTEGSVAISDRLSSISKKNKSSTYTHAEGIKLPIGITLMNFTKYYVRKHCNPILKLSVYEQLSVAKTFNFGNVRDKSLTIQLGYFWDKSLKIKSYKISGVVFSIWLEA